MSGPARQRPAECQRTRAWPGAGHRRLVRGDLVAEGSEPAGIVPSSGFAQLLAAIAAVAPGDMAMVKDGQFMIILSGQRHTT